MNLIYQDVLLWKEKVRRYRAGFCRCRILLTCFYQELHSAYTPLLGLRCLFGSIICYSRSSSKPTDHTTIRFYTNSPCANGNAIISTGRKTGSLGFFQVFAVIYNVTILTFVPSSHCSETKVFQQFHERTAPLQAQCKERHSWAFLGKLNRQRQSRNLSVPHGK